MSLQKELKFMECKKNEAINKVAQVVRCTPFFLVLTVHAATYLIIFKSICTFYAGIRAMIHKITIYMRYS